MKHLNNLACMLAMLTAGSMGFTACSSDDVVDGGNTNNGVAGKMVKTSFALNIPYGGKSGRMTADNTQVGENPTFRGMDDMRLLAFDDAVSLTKKATKKIVLGTTEQAFETNDNRRIYRDVTIPVGTKNFLFYGKTELTPSTATQKFAVGSIEDAEELSKEAGSSTANDNIDLSKVTFNLEQIHSSTFSTNDTTQLAKVAKALEDVYSASYNGKAWANCTQSETDMEERHAATLFARFKGMHAGSATSVSKTLEYLINSCGGAPTGTASNILEAIALKAKEAQNSLAGITFPANLHLPDGVARGNFNDQGKFQYINPVVMGENSIDYTNITYPAALHYYVNTPVGASDKLIGTLADGSWPAYSNWKNDKYTWPTDTWADVVGNNTRTIALKKAIQYAVASLETKVSVSRTISDFEDNAITAGSMLNNQKFSIGNGFELTGILIGGQPSVVGYDYTPTTTTNVNYNYTVYDKDIENKTLSSVGSSVTNYTLVLDNTNAASGATKNIFVTIELVNNTGVDFYGADGLVPNGSKFYLVGEVKYADGSYTTGEGLPEKPESIFAKDFKTKLNLNIGKYSLQKAYNTIPDLRSTQISLGLAVDLEWKDGITFDVEL